MSDYNEAAAEMIELTQKRARLMRKLIRVDAEICELLQDHGKALGIDAATMARAAEPKDR